MTFDIVGKRKIFFSLSSLLVTLSIVFLFVFGLKPGIDFTGGSLLELSFTQARPELVAINQTFVDIGYNNVRIQPTEGNGYLVKLQFISEAEHLDILSGLRAQYETEANKVLEERIETIGPVVSAHLKERSFKAAIAVVLAIIAYIAYAFRKVSKPVQSWKYGLTAIIALLHDVLITMGVFALLGRYMSVEVDIPFVVAMLTILGYSVNDTIVVFDRVRENLIKYGYEYFDKVVNKGINETVVRSLNTSLTTLLVLFALFLFGGDSIHYFSLALIIGIFFGTYSSIFLASPLLVIWERFKK